MTPLIHNKDSIFHLRPMDALQIGATFYTVKRVCRGGMGFVLLLSQDFTRPPSQISSYGSRIAVKAVLAEAADEVGSALFKRELSIWAGFRHPNIVSLLEIVDGGKTGWLAVMDQCEGSLRDMLVERGKLSLQTSAVIIGDVLSGLAYAYSESQILHLDLKPENLLYTGDFGRVMKQRDDSVNPLLTRKFMVSDWGISSVKESRLNALVGNTPTGTVTAETFNNMGTILYMAPERFKRGVSSSISSDVFALGMIYLELLTGKLPFSTGGHPVDSLLSGQYFNDARQLLSAATIPAPMNSLILSMITPTASSRPQEHSTLRHLIDSSYRRSVEHFSSSDK